MNWRYWARHPREFTRRLWHFAYEKLHPSEPFLAPDAVRYLDRNLSRGGRALEWGSGRSTAWIARRVASLVSVEHDAAWQATVEAQLRANGSDNVDYRVYPLEHSESEPTRAIYDPVPRYVDFVSEFPDGCFSFIEIDGHYRQACVRAALPKLEPGGLLLVDDTSWIPLEEWGVPGDWPIVHQSVKINTVTSIWRRPMASGKSEG